EDEPASERVADGDRGDVAGVELREPGDEPLPPAVRQGEPDLGRDVRRQLVARIDGGIALSGKVIEPGPPVHGRVLTPTVPDDNDRADRPRRPHHVDSLATIPERPF